jgi:hypothetical protein
MAYGALKTHPGAMSNAEVVRQAASVYQEIVEMPILSISDAIIAALKARGLKIQSMHNPGCGKTKTFVLTDGRVLRFLSGLECLEQIEVFFPLENDL